MLFKSGVIVAFYTLISRVFGLARELFVASLFGASSEADAVNVAFKLPNLFRRIFGEGALSSVFVPIFNNKILQSKKTAENFTSEVLVLLLASLIALVVIMQILMPSLMFIIAPGFHEDKAKFDLAVLLCRLTMPYLVFISVTALFGGVLNSVKRFAAFAFSPVILSLVVIIATVMLGNIAPLPISISISLLIAGLLQVVFMLFCVLRAGFRFFLTSFSAQDKDVKKLLKNMGPATLSAGVSQLNIFFSQSIASFIPGAVSILSYADRIYQFPLSIIGVTFSTILLPELSRTYKTNDIELANKIQNKAVKASLLLSLPAAFGIICLAHPIIHIIYQRGAFSALDTLNTANAISAFALGLPAFILNKILTPIFYANHDTKTPLKITIYSLLANTVLNVIFMIPFAHVGIALGSSIAGWLNVWLLYKYAKRYNKFVLHKDLVIFTFKVLASCAIMAAMILWVSSYYSSYFYVDSTLIKTAFLASLILLAGGAFAITSLYFKLHEILLKK